MRPFFLTVEGWPVGRLADIDELAVIWPAREVAKVLLEVGEAGGAACEDGLGEGEVDHDVLNLVGTHLALRQGFVELVISDITLLLRLGDELLDGGFVEIDQRSVVVLFCLGFGCHKPGLVRSLFLSLPFGLREV